MKILDRYVLAVFFRFFLMGLGLLVTLFVLIMFFELIGEFVKYKAPLTTIANYFFNKLPEAAYYMTPMAVLAGAILAFSMMSKDREVLAVMTGGVSTFRISLPLLCGAAFIAVFAFLDSEFVMPRSFKKSEDILHHQVKKQADATFFKQDRIWLRTADEDIWNIGFLDATKQVLNDVTVVRFSKDMGGFSTIISAKKAYKSVRGGWVFEEGIERKFDAHGEVSESAFASNTYGLKLDFGELKQAVKVPQEMNFAEITKYIHRIKTAGYNDIRYSVDRWVKITFPLISLVMAFIAIPFGLNTGGRTGGTLSGITVSVIIGFVFWFAFSMTVSMGHSGKLPPFLSAMGAHLLFIFGTMYVMLSESRGRG